MKVLFHRDWQGFSGGHLKVWHYFSHLLAGGHDPYVHFSPTSRPDPQNPWNAVPDRHAARWAPERYDAIFLAGLDWAECPLSEPAPPVINLIQHVRHADPCDPRHAFLGRRALRICVSEEVEAALRTSGRVNGPLVTIPNGIDLGELPAPPAVAGRELFIAGIKQPALAQRLASRLEAEGWSVDCVTEQLPRREFLARLSTARIVLLLPDPSEGFYLPALEAMALGRLVVCPDCVGNRSFCHDGVNSWRPAYNEDVLLAALAAVRRLPRGEANRICAAASATAARFTLARERAAFLDLIDRLPEYR